MSTIATHPDEAAAEAIRRHHDAMIDDLTARVTAVTRAPEADFEAARAKLLDWLRSELVPHAIGEENTFYRAAGETVRGRLLIEAMVSEHSIIRDFVEQIDSGTDRGEVIGWAGALLRVFVGHAALENDLVLPLLVAEPDIDLQDLLHRMHGH
jgi:iron-sulfur cluster repair protein YtfE (RIC family)